MMGEHRMGGDSQHRVHLTQVLSMAMDFQTGHLDISGDVTELKMTAISLMSEMYLIWQLILQQHLVRVSRCFPGHVQVLWMQMIGVVGGGHRNGGQSVVAAVVL